MGRTSTRVGPSDKRGIPVPRTRRVFACVAERKLAATALYGWPTFAIREADRAKGKPENKKNIFLSPFFC